MSCGCKMVYLMGLTTTIFYQGTRVMHQMGHTQGVPPDGTVFDSTPITASAALAIRVGWVRTFHSVEPEGKSGKEKAYTAWLITQVWPTEKIRRATLLSEIEGTPEAAAADTAGLLGDLDEDKRQKAT